ncbi:MAG: recombinase family protein [Oxalobacteraceae bacterium]|nr:MAG: recombinase family protein [Oxalobacteraceae bacterium]
MSRLDRTAVAYMRTSSAANVGEDKDSGARQRLAIGAYAKGAGFSIAAEFYDTAVRGSDPVDTRLGFAELLGYLRDHPETTTIIVETANRFARDLIVQETGFAILKSRGVDLIAADSPGSFLEDTPTAILIRQILGAVAQFEKASIVGKLRGARIRKKAAEGKCEGRKNHAELQPELVAMAKRLRRKDRTTGKHRSFRAIAAALADQGHVNVNGRPYAAASVRSMLTGPQGISKRLSTK